MPARPSAVRAVCLPTGAGVRPLPNALELRAAAHGDRYILIVDSHDDNRDLYAEWFTLSGLRVTSCSTAAAALETVTRDVPDAIIASVRLRDEDGFGLCDALRRLPHTAGIPLIALTTGALDHRRAIDQARFAAVVMIPCLPNALLELLVEILTRSRPHLTSTAA